MLRKSLLLVFALVFVIAGSEAFAWCNISDLDAKPETFKANQTINFKIHYRCSVEVKNVEIEILHIKSADVKDQVAAKYGVKLSTGGNIDVSGNGFKGGQGTFSVIFKRGGSVIASKTESTVCKSWSIGRY
jgi:hypothetical protein